MTMHSSARFRTWISRSLQLPLTLCIIIIIIIICCIPVSSQQNDVSDDYYCGTSWPNAAEQCMHSCPTGTREECSDLLGQQYTCHKFTGCKEKLNNGETVEEVQEVIDAVEDLSGVNNNFCGVSWIDAMFTCGVPCPTGTECGGTEDDDSPRCYAATNCDKPLQRLVADMLVTLIGPDKRMENEDGDILGNTISDILRSIVEDEGIALDGVGVGDQSVAGQRELQQRYQHRELKGGWQGSYNDENGVQMKFANVTQRMLGTGSSALDVSMVITGDYRPPPYHDLNVIAEDSINREAAKVVSTLRERGEQAGRSFFERVEGIEALRKEVVTKRPTREPTKKPTGTPTFTPTEASSSFPSEALSSVPSSMPSIALEQVIMMGSSQDLAIGGTTTSSYGYIFNMRTRKEGGAILLTAFDFYTESTDMVNIELWTRQGSFADHKGDYDGWDLIASGSVKGRGIGRYTSIPEELFTPVSIPGGGGEEGTRAFYISMDTKDLVYKIGEGTSSDIIVQAEDQDVEVYEGEGVLFYPFPSAEDLYFYRYPRQFLGTIQYDRMPCKPYSLYGLVLDITDGCPKVPTGSPSLPRPTNDPVVPPSYSPSKPSQANFASVAPTISTQKKVPTMVPTQPRPSPSPSAPEPTTSPIVPMRANVISVFRNVPERDMTSREIEKYIDITTAFLKRHTENSMVIEGIDMWHHKMTSADADTADGRGLKKRNKPKEMPQVPAVEITMIIRISVATLPLEYLGNLAAVTIDENQDELLALLNEQSAFYTYFKVMDGVQSRTVEIVTMAPTEQPTTTQQYLDNQEGLIVSADDASEESNEGSNVMVVVGVSIGVLWCCLTITGICYVMKRRANMQEEYDMEDLLRQDKIDPMETAIAVAVGEGKGHQEKTADVDEESPEPPKENYTTTAQDIQPKRSSDVFLENDKDALASISNRYQPQSASKNVIAPNQVAASSESGEQHESSDTTGKNENDQHEGKRKSSRRESNEDGRRRSRVIDNASDHGRRVRSNSRAMVSSLRASLTGSFSASLTKRRESDSSHTSDQNRQSRRMSRQGTSSFGDSLKGSIARSSSSRRASRRMSSRSSTASYRSSTSRAVSIRTSTSRATSIRTSRTGASFRTSSSKRSPSIRTSKQMKRASDNGEDQMSPTSSPSAREDDRRSSCP